MRQLIVMRHGEAEPIKHSDAQRALTTSGEQACRQAAKNLFAQRPEDLQKLQILHSPFRRTTQTAALVSAEFAKNHCELKPSQSTDKLLSEQSPDKLINWLENAVANEQNVMLISHQPLVSSLLALLVEGTRDYSRLRQYPMWPASVAVLQFEYLVAGCAKLIALDHYVS